MRRFVRQFRNNKSGVAALEFGLCAPFLITGMAAAFDLGYAMWARSCLANAVSQGAYYAFLTYQSGTTVTPAHIQSVVQNATPLSGIPAPSITGPNYYCPSGSPLELGTAGTATSSCAALGGNDGYYVAITAQYTLTAILPFMNPVIQESVTVRLQ